MRKTYSGPSRTEVNGRLAHNFSLPFEILVEYTPAVDKRADGDMLLGTLDLLVLQTLAPAPAHGHTIAHAIEKGSDGVLEVEHGSLYPSLYRLEEKGWIASSWGTSENNRKAKYYTLTPQGRKQLTIETERWDRLADAVNRILRPVTE